MRQVIIYGPPGTGKTTTLLNVVEEALARGVEPERIAFVSFTRKAANEARDRAVVKFPNVKKKQFHFFKTIHSLSFARLGLEIEDVLKPEDWDAINLELEIKLRLSYHDIQYPLYEQPVKTAGDVALFYIGKARVEEVPWREYFVNIPASIRERHDLDVDSYLRVGETIERYKQDRGLVDFTDMLELALERCDPIDLDVAIVDEAQDLSKIQWQVIDRFFAKAQELHIAGDDDQAVFRWAGADVSSLLSRTASADEVRVLELSYRLPRAVFAVADKIIQRVEGPRQSKQWRPRGAEGVATYFSDLHQVPLHEPGTWYLLSRAKAYFPVYLQHLRALNMPYVLQGKPSISLDEIRGLLAYQKLGPHRMEITGADVRLVYDLLRTEHLSEDAYDIAKALDPQVMYHIEYLQQHAGLLTSLNQAIEVENALGHDYLKMSNEKRMMYYRLLKTRRDRGINYLEPPRHFIDTIHAVKGGEADHVVILSDFTKTIRNEYDTDPAMKDDEHRLFYVAATRAKETLWIARHTLSGSQYTYPTEGLCSIESSTPPSNLSISSSSTKSSNPTNGQLF